MKNCVNIVTIVRLWLDDFCSQILIDGYSSPNVTFVSNYISSVITFTLFMIITHQTTFLRSNEDRKYNKLYHQSSMQSIIKSMKNEMQFKLLSSFDIAIDVLCKFQLYMLQNSSMKKVDPVSLVLCSYIIT